ncbi:phytoene/squalene synthase family protein [Lichenihabitans sp. PAMC28606]|uniref:phytoene/squalene synthase family protein n=1 Tax=Lichenihabitans sp. PAMC28606 TaxID=2880932 RepID=UPI001D0B0DE0|nr:phytoene/squalene synthase family protein [Lichenihabitans sp. PAMC28606]UDL93081.1 phytoene/squalene synthase family protein [Lichenihabitans sp. PAMC28606]
MIEASDPSSSSVAALASATAILRAKGKSFYWARRLLGTRHASNATRLYGFCRLLDDTADEAASHVVAKSRLAEIADDVRSGQTNDPALLDALALIRECKIDVSVVLDLIAGVESDLGVVCLQTEAELLHYCYRVAGTVGLMMCNVLDVTEPAAYPHAVDLGIGMQLTNICRDVAEDAALGRRYLPASLLSDISAQDLVTPTAATRRRLRACLATLLDQADLYYRSGQDGMRYLPVRARAGILSAARIYHAIGDGIRARDYACWDGRVTVGRKAKLRLTASALMETVGTLVPRPRSILHDASLHHHLVDVPSLAKARHAG